MNFMLITASILLIIIGLIHSILGEILIFKKVRISGVVPDLAAPPIQLRNMRILWATWHLASIFGFALSVIIFVAAKSSIDHSTLLEVISFAMLIASMLVCYATKGKHPGWIGLLGVALLCWLA